MKRILVPFFFFITLSAHVFGQCPPPQVANEIGTRLFSLNDASGLGPANAPGQAYHPTLLSGIHFKHYNEVGAFRLSFGYMSARNRIDAGNDCTDCLSSDSNGAGGMVKIGYERFTFVGPFEPYIAVDAFISYDQYTSDVQGFGISGDYQEYSIRNNRTGVGVSPSIGLRFFFSYSLSLGAETSLNAGLYMHKTTRNTVSPIPENRTDENNGFGWEYHPVNSLSLNVMF